MEEHLTGGDEIQESETSLCFLREVGKYNTCLWLCFLPHLPFGPHFN